MWFFDTARVPLVAMSGPAEAAGVMDGAGVGVSSRRENLIHSGVCKEWTFPGKHFFSSKTNPSLTLRNQSSCLQSDTAFWPPVTGALP